MQATGLPAALFLLELQEDFNYSNFIMIIMKNKLLLTIASLILLTVACKKKLDIPNPNGPTSADVWTTADYAQKGVNAIYSTYHRVGLMPHAVLC